MPEAAVAHDGDGALSQNPDAGAGRQRHAVAEDRELPMEKGGKVPKEWQPMSAETWNGSALGSPPASAPRRTAAPDSRCSRAGGAGGGPPRAQRLAAQFGDFVEIVLRAGVAEARDVPSMNFASPPTRTSDVYSPAIGSMSLAAARSGYRRGAGWMKFRARYIPGWPSSTTSTAFLLAQKPMISSGTSG